MLRLLGLLLGSFRRLFSFRRHLLLENLALRQQLMVFKRHDSRPKMGWPDKLFWVMTRRLWSQWKQALVIVTPETVVRWHRAGFRLYWNWISRHRKISGRKRISKELRELIFRMVVENPTWGASCRTTAKLSLPWTSSLFPPSPLESCTASSSLATTADAFCISE